MGKFHALLLLFYYFFGHRVLSEETTTYASLSCAMLRDEKAVIKKNMSKKVNFYFTIYLHTLHWVGLILGLVMIDDVL